MNEKCPKCDGDSEHGETCNGCKWHIAKWGECDDCGELMPDCGSKCECAIEDAEILLKC